MIWSERRGKEYLCVHKGFTRRWRPLCSDSCLMGGVAEMDKHTMTVTVPLRHLIQSDRELCVKITDSKGLSLIVCKALRTCFLWLCNCVCWNPGWCFRKAQFSFSLPRSPLRPPVQHLGYLSPSSEPERGSSSEWSYEIRQ